MDTLEFTHRRKNLLTGDWVLVSPHRNNRPWQGAQESSTITLSKGYDAECPLCPTNKRANKTTNPNYKNTFVFTNDFGALVPESSADNCKIEDSFFEVTSASGCAKVICYSPLHNKTLAMLAEAEIINVINTWQEEYINLSKQYHNVHIFENKGEIMGCSQPHPHGQIWAHDHRSTEIITEDKHQLAYYNKHKRSLLADYITREKLSDERIVIENEHWLVVVPYWAAWPFETLLLSKDDIQTFEQLTNKQKSTLACILKELTVRYDNVFNCSFPYSMGWHNAPKDLHNNKHWRLHAHFYPPLLRSATIKKHMVGYEMLAESQRDLTAETACKLLRAASKIHYTEEV